MRFLPRGLVTRLVRKIQVVRGTMRFAIDLQPRFNYGRSEHKLEVTDHGAVFSANGTRLAVHAIGPPDVSIRDLGLEVQEVSSGLRWKNMRRPRPLLRISS